MEDRGRCGETNGEESVGRREVFLAMSRFEVKVQHPIRNVQFLTQKIIEHWALNVER
jgi:hypothetical protein